MKTVEVEIVTKVVWECPNCGVDNTESNFKNHSMVWCVGCDKEFKGVFKQANKTLKL